MQVLYSTGTTTHAREHLRKEHRPSEAESSSTAVPDKESTEHEFDLEEFKKVLNCLAYNNAHVFSPKLKTKLIVHIQRKRLIAVRLS
jgi:hypothetical protein